MKYDCLANKCLYPFFWSDLGHEGGAEMSRRKEFLELSDSLRFHAVTVSFVCDHS